MEEFLWQQNVSIAVLVCMAQDARIVRLKIESLKKRYSKVLEYLKDKEIFNWSEIMIFLIFFHGVSLNDTVT